MKYITVVYDRDGDIINYPEDYEYDTWEEADRAGDRFIDNPRYGSHEVEEEP